MVSSIEVTRSSPSKTPLTGGDDATTTRSGSRSSTCSITQSWKSEQSVNTVSSDWAVAIGTWAAVHCGLTR